MQLVVWVLGEFSGPFFAALDPRADGESKPTVRTMMLRAADDQVVLQGIDPAGCDDASLELVARGVAAAHGVVVAGAWAGAVQSLGQVGKDADVPIERFDPERDDAQAVFEGLLVAARGRARLADDAEERLARAHLDGFADAFVREEYRAQWRALASGSNLERAGLFGKFRHHAEPGRFREVGRAAAQATRLTEALGAVRGLLVMAGGVEGEMSVEDACEMAEGEDALFSVTPGALAFVFDHEGGGWLCDVTFAPV